ncbi:MAG TPA: penicillin-binding protein 2, partial [Phycisphaerae bacterium]|nr:penicillin-binding protein 2 [Phycisphaerae bacterium]
RDGFHVVLTIDAEIQANVERELIETVSKYKAESAVAIVMHPQTGAILAMANAPGFDPNHYRDYGAAYYRNKSVTDPYEPGSTFKPFIASGALAEKAVRRGEVFDCERGSWTDGARTLRDHHPYDFLSFEEVLIKSSNIGMGKIGKRLGNEKLFEYCRTFGFGEKTGVDLIGEDAGILRPLARWNSFSTTSIPMGQELCVTPLQLARGYCAFANGGKIVKPYVLRAVMDAGGEVVSDFTPPLPEEPVISPEIIETMKDKILVEVVRQAASQHAKLPNYTVFGKTGTAQIAKKGGGGYVPNAYVSSFVGGAPAKNPQLVVLVAVRKPQKSIGYYGAVVAAPAAARILSHALAYLGVPPEPPAQEPIASSNDPNALPPLPLDAVPYD